MIGALVSPRSPEPNLKQLQLKDKEKGKESQYGVPVYINGQLVYQNRMTETKKGEESEENNNYITVDNNNVYLDYSKKNSKEINLNELKQIAQTEASREQKVDDEEMKAQSVNNNNNHHHRLQSGD